MPFSGTSRTGRHVIRAIVYWVRYQLIKLNAIKSKKLPSMIMFQRITLNSILDFPFLISSALEDVASILRYINVSILFYSITTKISVRLDERNIFLKTEIHVDLLL